MSHLVEVDWNPDDRTLRHFGVVGLLGFGLVAFLAWKELLVFSFGLGAAREPLALGLAGLALLSALLGALWPRGNRPIFVAVTALALPIGFVLSYVIMIALYYLAIAPIGLALRALGRDPMDRRFLPAARSYFEDARPPRPRERYFKQF